MAQDPTSSEEREPVILTPLAACRERMERALTASAARLDACRERAERVASTTKAHIEASQKRIASYRRAFGRDD